MIDATIVMTAHNEVRLTSLAVSSIRESYPSVKIIIVDHSSTDETETYVRRLEKLNKNVEYIRYEGDRNLAHCWNLGVSRCETDICIVTNNDVVFSTGSIEKMVKAAKHPHIGVVVPQDNNVSLAGSIIPDKIRIHSQNLLHEIKVYDPKASLDASDFIAEVNAWWCGYSSSLDQVIIIPDAYYPAGGYCFAVQKKKWKKLHGFNSLSYD